MSAKDELYSLACQDMPVSGTEVREAMESWRNEILREAAARIRAANGRREASYIKDPAAWAAVNWAADLIDVG